MILEGSIVVDDNRLEGQGRCSAWDKVLGASLEQLHIWDLSIWIKDLRDGGCVNASRLLREVPEGDVNTFLDGLSVGAIVGPSRAERTFLQTKNAA